MDSIWGECKQITQKDNIAIVKFKITKEMDVESIVEIPMSINHANTFEIGATYKISFAKYETLG